MLAGRASLPVAGLVAACGAAVVGLAASRREHSSVGELVACTALTGASAIVLVADGVPGGTALAWWGAWAAGFALVTLGVRRILAQHKRGERRTSKAQLRAIGIITSVVAAVAGVFAAIVV